MNNRIDISLVDKRFLHDFVRFYKERPLEHSIYITWLYATHKTEASYSLEQLIEAGNSLRVSIVEFEQIVQDIDDLWEIEVISISKDNIIDDGRLDLKEKADILLDFCEGSLLVTTKDEAMHGLLSRVFGEAHS